MPWYFYLQFIVEIPLVIFLLTIFIRTAMFKPKGVKSDTAEKIEVDEKKAISDLQDMIRLKTVSDTDALKEDDEEFLKFKNLLFKKFPNVVSECEFIDLGKRSLLFKWKGADSSKCRVLMAHYDVVSAEESMWSRPAFEAVIEGDTMYGRGTLDTKVTLNAIMQAAEKLIQENFKPSNDIYLAFSGNEEINGDGAVKIVNYFKENNIVPAMVSDEGGAVVEKVFPGVDKPCALVGIAEKGLCNIKFSFDGKGGHASAPPAHTGIGKLGKVCTDIENSPFKMNLSPAAKNMFDTLGRHSTFFYRMIFANLWCFKGLLNRICKKSGGELNALMRTTVAFTQMQGSKGMNVLPAHAEMTANLRIMCGESVESAHGYIDGIIKDGDIKTEVIYGMDPSDVSDCRDEEWKKLVGAIEQTWQGSIVSPYLMLACSDSRHYRGLCQNVYRFSAMALTTEERAGIHGNDERIKLENIVKAVAFYVRLIKSFNME